jgi:hypothetical protein
MLVNGRVRRFYVPCASGTGHGFFGIRFELSLPGPPAIFGAQET